MQKYMYGLIALAFAAGMGTNYFFMNSFREPKIKTQPVEQATPVEKTIAAAEPKEEKSKEENNDDDEEDDDMDDLAGNYADPATCAALTDAATYTGKHEDFMYMLPGKDHWVFRSRQDLQTKFEMSEEDGILYNRFIETLKAKGTDLVLAYIPTRAMIASAYLPEGSEIVDDFDPAIARENYNALIDLMRSKGIQILGTPEPSIGATYFNHADQHWTTKGAEDMAKAVAAYVATLPVASSLPKATFKTIIGEEVSYDGRFGEFIEEICDFRPNPEKDFKVKTNKEGGDVEADLFGDQTEPQVVLIGTSNSRRDEFNTNFDGYLKEALSTDVYNAAISGGGMDDSLLAYLVSNRFRKTPPKLIVWELPGYYDLGGAGMGYALRQGIAAASGDCANPLATLAPTVVEGKKVTLFDKLDENSIAPDHAYIRLQFDKPLAKDFSISIKSNDKSNEKFKFTKRREGNASEFYYLPKSGEEGALLSSISLNVNKSIEGQTVQAKLCPIATPAAAEAE